MKSRPSTAGHRFAGICAALLGTAALLGACTNHEDVAVGFPEDYRLRHPIAITEGERAVVIFVAGARGGLSASQRADVIGLARVWSREGTGAIVAEVPVDSPNARPAADAFREVRSLLGAAGVPPRAIVVRHYRPPDPFALGTIRLTYPKIAAVAGPCGLWPDDLGPSIDNPYYTDNKPYYNFGCATQRNLAAMIDNPADLVQPRPEAPAYTARRTAMFKKYRAGESTAVASSESDKAKLSDIGK